MAKAVSGEAGVPFFSVSGSEFVEMFVGVGASRVRDLFEQAKRNSPCIIFIDEIDAVGRYRGTGLGGSHDEREQTLNQILVEMDGFGTDANVILDRGRRIAQIFSTRRFYGQVVLTTGYLDRPDIQGRRAILNVHVKGKPMAPDVDYGWRRRQTPGFVGADSGKCGQRSSDSGCPAQQTSHWHDGDSRKQSNVWGWVALNAAAA